MTTNRPGHKKECKRIRKECETVAEATAEIQHSNMATIEGPSSVGNPLLLNAATAACLPAAASVRTACAHCGTTPFELLICTGCIAVGYCSLQYQRDAWCVLALCGFA